MTAITRFEYRMHAIFEAFEEAMEFSELRYPLAALQQYGFEDEAAIYTALNRAIRICKSLEVDPRKHFRPYFTAGGRGMPALREWRVSKLGYYLVLCNGEPDNPYVGAFQMELLKNLPIEKKR